MDRIARYVVPGLPHHVTQRGNRRERVFFGDEDYRLCRGFTVTRPSLSYRSTPLRLPALMAKTNPATPPRGRRKIFSFCS